MSVIAKKLRGSHFMVLVKGAPEALEPLCEASSLPPDYSARLAALATAGYRVVALAGRTLKANFLRVQKMTREVAERDLTFLGFLVMQNTLKPESAGVIRELRTASLRCLMVTGDNLLTAVSVARYEGQISGSCKRMVTIDVPRDCGLLDEEESVLTVSHCKQADGSHHLTFDEAGGEGVGAPRLAITGRVWTAVKEQFPALVPRLLLRTVVWARMSPDQKAGLVESLQELGYVAAMCGDGANDCGALKVSPPQHNP